MSDQACRHPDVRKFDGLRCCLACGEAEFEAPQQTLYFHSYSASSTQYEYTNLNYKLGQEIRLCVLLPGEPDDPLICEIIHVNLEDDPDFEAVSYTWAGQDGDASLSRSIHCGNDKYLPIGSNCDHVLRQLRMRGLRRRLWIDSICINQSNVGERSHQVGFMDQIYTRANCVRVCIKDDAMKPGSLDYKSLFQVLKRGFATQDEPVWVSVAHMLSHRYFRRVWVSQQLLKAGSHAPADCACTAKVIQEVALARAVYLRINNDEILLSSTVMGCLNRIATRNEYHLPGALRLRWAAEQAPLAEITSCLRAGLEGECADPLDQIFAVLSFVDPRARAFISVDYSLNPVIVYANAISAVLVCHQNLDILSEVSVGNEDGWQSHPALTRQQFLSFLQRKDSDKCLTYESRSTTIRGSRPMRQFSNDMIGPWKSKIEVRVMDELPSPPTVAPGQTLISYQSLRVTAQQNNQLLGLNIFPRLQVCAHYVDILNNSVSAGGDDKPFINWTYLGWLITDAKLLSNKECSGFNDGSQSFLRKHFPASGFEELTEDQHMGINLTDLRLFVAEAENLDPSLMCFSTTYSFGSAFPKFQRGDEVWAIDGARAPFILRRTDVDRYRIVCDCYLWAALRLDYWSPGTKKGKWSNNRSAREGQQARAIEIH